MTATEWFFRVFPGVRVDWRWPAVRDARYTYILIPAAELGEAREWSQGRKLPRPVVPVVVGDLGGAAEPVGRWVQLTGGSLVSLPDSWWGIGMDDFNSTVEIMKTLTYRHAAENHPDNPERP